MEIQAVVKHTEVQAVLKNYIESQTGKFVHGDVKLVSPSGMMAMPGQSFDATCVISDEPAPIPSPVPMPVMAGMPVPAPQ